MNGTKTSQGMWINGKNITLTETIGVYNPATGELVAHIAKGGEQEAKQAVDAAWRAFPRWSKHPAKARAAFLHQWGDRIVERREELAALMTAEQGKPYAEALGEIDVAAEFVYWYGEEAKRLQGEVIPGSRSGQRMMVIRQPIGVAGLITPWNFPAAMVTRKVAPALAAGCTVVLKPAKQTPLTAIALFQSLIDTGLPAGVANLVTGAAADIGNVFLSDSRVRKLSFTGSTEVGKRLMQGAARDVKRLSLELGGNAPAIVFPDADLDLTAEAIVSNKFENAGQVCNGINVIYAHRHIRETLIEKIVALVKQLNVGRGDAPDVHIGPLIDRHAGKKVARLVSDAVSKGATVLLGGYRLQGDGYDRGEFYAPTVLTDVSDEMALTREEIFGPVAPILIFTNERDLLARCNRTPYGLAAYVFTRDISRVYRISEALEFGMVGVNGTSLSVPQAPFGGIKESGMGREGGCHGMEEFLNMKYIALTVAEKEEW